MARPLIRSSQGKCRISLALITPLLLKLSCEIIFLCFFFFIFYLFLDLNPFFIFPFNIPDFCVVGLSPIFLFRDEDFNSLRLLIVLVLFLVLLFFNKVYLISCLITPLASSSFLIRINYSTKMLLLQRLHGYTSSVQRMNVRREIKK